MLHRQRHPEFSSSATSLCSSSTVCSHIMTSSDCSRVLHSTCHRAEEDRFQHIQFLKDDRNAFEEPSIPYPKSVAFIISNEFCERFNYYGMRTILVLYLTNKLDYNEETATVLFHTFTMLVYIFPLIGALIADGWLGKYKTILYLSLVYSLGALVVSFGAVPITGMPVKAVTVVGLLLIAIGTGGIKPCVSAFGGDQFSLPAQSLQLAKFFSLFYFAINAGSLISTTFTPILRADVHCFGDQDCFSLAFGVPAILMIISVVIFMAGKRLYKCQPPAGNMIFGVSRCIADAFKGWQKRRHSEPMESFLDYAKPTVGARMVRETKCLGRILRLFLPFPVFWALFDQQGSRWTFQATRMDGMVWGYQIKPDQMQVVNPLLILGFLPLFDYIVYPILARCGIRRPLQKLTIGLLLAALGFFLSAGLEMKMEQAAYTGTPTEHDMAHLRIFNGMPCRYEISSAVVQKTETPRFIEPLNVWEDLSLQMPKSKEYAFKAQPVSGDCPAITSKLRLQPGKSVSYFLAQDKLVEFADGLQMPATDTGRTSVRALLNTPDDEGPIHLSTKSAAFQEAPLTVDKHNVSQLHRITPGFTRLDINGTKVASFEAKGGRIYSVLVSGSARDGYQYNLVEGVAPSTVSILWQLPQIVVMTAAEVMFSVTGLEFSYSQSPPSMKSVLQACWLLSVAIGNMLVVVIAEFKFTSSQSGEFTLFASLMLVDMLIFLWLARSYQYKDQREDLEDDDDAVIENVMQSKPKPTTVNTTPRKAGGIEAEPGYGAYRNHAYDNDFSEA
ncbi:peptide transporter family 1 isoform X3 [Drosophila erecta]|uniref:peptide transporter family 1 isoform X3 n=1 Tax=Drosophila erecta TaxID=7220 RepID=UPI000F060E80|nr:peptide transporter family 1 isoform X3 [Drosophila erecta]